MFNYSALFSGNNEEDEIDAPSMPQFSDRWKWFGMIERLWHERDEYQNRLQKRQDMMNKHK